MTAAGVNPQLLHAWLSGRSLARGVAQPVAEHGGFRVDTDTKVETSRWVFPEVGSGLIELAGSIRESRYVLKLCGGVDDLRSALPVGWRIDGPNYFMVASGERFGLPPLKGYTVEVDRIGPVVEVKIGSDDGVLAASGYAGETPSALSMIGS